MSEPTSISSGLNGFCSPESSLLLLYEPDQFIENAVDCPRYHLAHCAWQKSTAGSSPPVKQGELGQPKAEVQRSVVSRLTKELQDYVASPIPPHSAPDQGGGGGGGGGLLRMMRCA